MPDPPAGEELGERPVARVRPGVVAEQPLRLDSVAGVEGERAFDEAGHGRGTLIRVQLAVGEPGMIIDERMHPFVADSHPFLSARAVAVAGDRVSRPGETDEALAIDVEQVAGAGPLVAARLLTRLPGRP